MRLLILAAMLIVAGAASARGRIDCAKVVRDFHDAWGNEDDYVWSFPHAKQNRARACLDGSDASHRKFKNWRSRR
jgi:hypothetical protein